MKKSLTLTEIIVSSVILALVFGSLLASFVAARTYITRANKRLITVNYSRLGALGLTNAVREDQWNVVGGPLTVGLDKSLAGLGTSGHAINATPGLIDNINYTGYDYDVSAVLGCDYREAQVNLSYPQ